MYSNESRFDRRALLVGGAALAALGSTRTASAAADPHQGHHAIHATLARAALDCVARGDACTAHCLADLRAGHTELAQCASAVEELVVACRALARLAALGSEQLPRFAAATAEICKACEVECRKHEKHAPCKACAEACAKCIEECKAALA
jgi:Cys-rich four helix bundle protein (predicted Tat secretion target)